MRKLLHHSLQSSYFANDGCGALVHDIVQAAIGLGERAATVVAQDALSGKLDGGERVLDFVRHAAGHLAPCGRALCLNEVGQVLDNRSEEHTSELQSPD